MTDLKFSGTSFLTPTNISAQKTRQMKIEGKSKCYDLLKSSLNKKSWVEYFTNTESIAFQSPVDIRIMWHKDLKLKFTDLWGLLFEIQNLVTKSSVRQSSQLMKSSNTLKLSWILSAYSRQPTVVEATNIHEYLLSQVFCSYVHFELCIYSRIKKSFFTSLCTSTIFQFRPVLYLIETVWAFD